MMRILGLSGGMDFPHEDKFRSHLTSGEIHDSSAVLVEDGQVVAAFEEERLNRVKHTGKFPVYAIRKCLEMGGIELHDVDKIVFYCSPEELKFETVSNRHHFRDLPFEHPDKWISERLQQFFHVEYDPANIVFLSHHECHAASAYYMSGFNDSLVVTIDGASPEGLAGLVISATGDQFKVLDKISNADSLGSFYDQVIQYLGYTIHDEYKVMGLAPYGDPSRFRRLFRKAFNLLPEGKFKVIPAWNFVLMDAIHPRLKGEPFTQEHMDVAAALQEMLEKVVLHMLKHYRQATGHKKLCLAGGVAHNCSMNGKILYENLFDEVFVQPASHDAGNALGGALYLTRKLQPEIPLNKLRHLYWGTDIGDTDELERVFRRWDRFISWRKVDNVVETSARLIAEGAVIGWVQGRSEFGPRALGNRSILADPRPAENKSIINEMVKKREGYRPFAPSILEEYVSEYYEVPGTKAPLDYMNFVLRTKPEQQELLGAVTHVDGSARVQTVSRQLNEKYWSLIDEFRKLTGVPILLNTSFNNNAEPIVDSEDDAIVSFLTTNIHSLVIGDYIVNKKPISPENFLDCVPTRPISAELIKSVGYQSDGNRQTLRQIRLHFSDRYQKTVSEDVFRLLEDADGGRSLRELLEQANCHERSRQLEIVDELIELWSSRLVVMSPEKTFAATSV